MRTRRRRLPRTRAAARLPGSLKFGVTNDASANPCDGKSGFTRRAPRHRAGAVFTSMPRAGPRVLFIDDIILYRDDARQPLCPGFGRLSSRRPARMKAIARSQRVLRAPGSGRAWTRDRPMRYGPPGYSTCLPQTAVDTKPTAHPGGVLPRTAGRVHQDPRPHRRVAPAVYAGHGASGRLSTSRPL